MLGYEYQETSHGTALINEYCYDVPLLESLQSLLKCDSIVEQVHVEELLSYDSNYCTCRQLFCTLVHVLISLSHICVHKQDV